MTLTPDAARLSSLARRFLAAFANAFPNVQYDATIVDRLFFRVPAVHPAVGDLRIWDEGEELTLGIGDQHHEHHSLYMYSDKAPNDAEDLVVEHTIDVVRALFEEKLILGFCWDGDRLKWTSTHRSDYTESPDDHGGIGYEEFTWRGPRSTR